MHLHNINVQTEDANFQLSVYTKNKLRAPGGIMDNNNKEFKASG
jgi:hypothetical protein